MINLDQPSGILPEVTRGASPPPSHSIDTASEALHDLTNIYPWEGVGSQGISIPELRELLSTLSQDQVPQIDVTDIAPHLRLAGPELAAMKNNYVIPLIEKVHSDGPCSREEIDELVSLQQGTVWMFPDGHPNKPSLLEDLGSTVTRRYERLKSPSDADFAIKCYMQALSLIPAGDSQEIRRLLERLSHAYHNRFSISKDREDIGEAIASTEHAIALALESSSDLSRSLGNLRILLNSRFECFGDLSDLERAIELQLQLISIEADSGESRQSDFSALAGLFLSHFKHTKDPSDIEQAVSRCEEAVLSTPNEDPQLHMYRHNLSIIMQARFEFSSNDADLDKAILSCRAALSCLPQHHADEVWYLSRFVDLLEARIRHLTQHQDQDEAISCFYRLLAILPGESHATRTRFLGRLGLLLRLRFGSSGTLEDIDQSIGVYHQALAFYTRDDKSATETRDILTNLGIALTCRYERFGEVQDVEGAILCHRQALEMTTPEDSLRSSRLSELGSSFTARFHRTGDFADIDAAVECLRQAVDFESEDSVEKISRHQILAVCLVSRCEATGNLADLDEAIQLYRLAIRFLPDGHHDKSMLLNGIGNALNLRHKYIWKVADIDEAITFFVQSVLLTPTSHAKWGLRRVNAGTALLSRYTHLGQIEDLNKAIEYQEQGLAGTSSGHAGTEWRFYLILGESLLIRSHRTDGLDDVNRAVDFFGHTLALAVDDRMSRVKALTGLAQSLAARFRLSREPSDIDQAMEYTTQAILSLPAQHSKGRIQLQLAYMHFNRFQHSGTLYDLDKAIEISNDALKSTTDPHVCSQALILCGEGFFQRFLSTRTPEYLTKAAQYLRQASELTAAPLLDRFKSACKCARWSSSHKLEAYEHAISLLPQLLWIGVSVQRRYEIISTIEDVAVDAAAVAISSERLDLALEWLEAGRSIIWQQHLNLRLPLDELRVVSHALADRLETVASYIDRVDVPQFSDLDMSEPNSSERLSQQHRQYADEWQRLIDEIRAIPELNDFMRPTKASRLMQVAASGPVVVVNVASTSCDALVLIPESGSIGHVPLPNLSLQIASQARYQLFGLLHAHALTTRGIRKDHAQGTSVYEDILAMLWATVVKPVFEHLGLVAPIPIDERPHITWCTTGPLSFLPLHAAGFYREPNIRVFEYVVSSYTPTLSALLRAQQTSDKFYGVLAVGQAHTSGEAHLPGTIAELAQLQQHTQGLRFTQLEGENATADNVFSNMQSHSWVHLACHAVQNPIEPTKSAFLLHNSALDLATIMSKPVKSGGLAYLSACQTATGDANMPEEAVHLAAGMLMAGYSSVVATMWSIRDSDAPVVADGVYAELIKGGVADRRRAAKALHLAVANLRDQIGEQEYARWVPYIHIGC